VKPIVEVTMDCADAPALARFWAATLGYEIVASEPGVAYLRDPDGQGPFLCLLEVPESKTAKNRMHFDLVVAAGANDNEKWRRIDAEAARLESLGATVRGKHPPRYVGMSDPEGNEFDVTGTDAPAPEGGSGA
jgi:catechol 2,3-dioxygenase-like lactoylglutathione lyase family enzyme